MQHLRILKILDFVSAGMIALGILIVLATAAVTGFGLFAAGGVEALGAMVSVLVIDGAAIVFLLAFLAFCVFAGQQVGKGKGRILQTLLALGSVMNCPLGTAFAGYSLWVLWINEETEAIFSGETPVED